METGQYQETFLNTLLALVAAGIFFAYNFVVPMDIAIIISVIALITAALMTWQSNKFTFIPFCILFFMLGLLRFQSINVLLANDISNFAGDQVYVSGTIREQPRIILNADNTYSVRYVVDVEAVKADAENTPATGGMYINARYDSEDKIPAAQIGYKISAFGNLRKPTNYNNPGQIDVVTQLKSDGITATLSSSKMGVEIEYVEGSYFTKFMRTMASIREHYKMSMRQVMSNQDAAAIFAMLFGGYEGLKPELTESFVTTGIIHILSISGSHMSLLAFVTAWLCNLFSLKKLVKIFIGLFVISAYTVLSGFLFQVVRSAFMGFLVFFATSFGYESNSRRALTLIAMFILLYSPLALFHIGFQLSFTSTAGIIYLSPMIRRFLISKLINLKDLPKIFNIVNHPIKDFKMNTVLFITMSFACTISVMLLSEPIVAWHFNQLSVSALLSNLIVIPILEIIIIFGLIAGIVGLIIPSAAKFIFLVDSLVLGIAYELNKIIASLPGSNVYFPTINFAWSILYYVVFIIIVQKKKTQQSILKHKNLIKGIFTVLAAVIAFNVAYSFTKPPEMQVHFIDVHQGDCALVITPHGHTMMFDTGGVREHTFDIGSRVDIPYLHHYGVTELDYIFLTHAHEDHAAGAGSIIKKIPVKQIITAGESKSDYATSMAISETSSELKNMRHADEGEIFEVDGVKVEVLYAPKISEGVSLTGNEVSNVYKVTFKDVSFLFTGDLVKENEQIIIHENKNVRSTVLKVGHHGSKTSSSKEFIETVKPEYAVFCVGANNNFGHPRPEVLELIKDSGAKIYRTDKNGAIVFYTNGYKINVECFFN